jgi:type I restriction enzyme, S subunit
MSEWQEVTLEDMLAVSIPGEWGNEPTGIEQETIVLRAADFTKDCQLRELVGIERNIPPYKLCTRILKNGDILIEKSGGSPDQPVGRVAFFNKEADNKIYSFSNFLQLLRVSEKFDCKFVYYLFSFLYFSGCVYRYQQQTTGIINLKLENYLNEKVKIPFAIDEQQKIRSILSTIDQTIAQTEALIQKYQQIKAGLMHDLFTRGITPDGKLRPPREQAPELYRESAIGWIPKEWRIGLVRDLGNIKLGRQRSPIQHSGKWTTPYLRVANVFDGFIDFSDVLEMDFTPKEKDIFYVKYGDILLNEGQSLELVGRSSVYLGEDNQYCFQNTLVGEG